MVAILEVAPWSVDFRVRSVWTPVSVVVDPCVTRSGPPCKGSGPLCKCRGKVILILRVLKASICERNTLTLDTPFRYVFRYVKGNAHKHNARGANRSFRPNA